ncbi:hydroxymethylglutaryl-CoA lyase [Photobacterium makurazakiensis]|uniref:hydroxymethylglutaryl-CoA lyase n=1 Tax=Photobacterium makurazakiensis TaxID=2910234 RepID=UPI003D0B08DF
MNNGLLTLANLPKEVTIFEVGARDGLQNEPLINTEHKIAFINALSKSGLTHVEAGSFVSAKRVPQMADSANVLQQIERHTGVNYSALTPNIQGFEMALQANANEIAIFGSASETFSQRNINCSISDSLKRFESVIALAKLHQIPVRGYLSCICDCPYDGKTSPNQVAAVAKSLIDLGCYEVSLGDTIGTGTPIRVAKVLEATYKQVDTHRLAVHFHNTWGQALANIYQAVAMGITTIDSSTAGLGGCPYAEGASGNVATEDVLYLCHELGIHTGVDLNTIAQAGWDICHQLNKVPQSNVSLALLTQHKKGFNSHF